MAELARKDGRSLGIATKKLKTRQECRAGAAAEGEGLGQPLARLAWGLEFTVPVGTRKVANEALSEPDLPSHTLLEETKESLRLGATARAWRIRVSLEPWPQGVWILNLDSAPHTALEMPRARI